MVFYAMAAALTMVIIVTVGLSLLKEPDFKNVHKEISDIATAVHAQYQKRPDYWGLNTQKVLDGGNLPDYLRGHGKIVSRLGRDIVIGSNTSGDTAMPGTRQFMVTIGNLSMTACRGLLKSVKTAVADPALEMISVENENGVSNFYWGEENSLADLPSKADSICRNRNSISWSFR